MCPHSGRPNAQPTSAPDIAVYLWHNAAAGAAGRSQTQHAATPRDVIVPTDGRQGRVVGIEHPAGSLSEGQEELR
jgi:hypothetical protein